MRRLFVLMLFVLGAACLGHSQDDVSSSAAIDGRQAASLAPERFASTEPGANVAANFAATSAANVSLFQPARPDASVTPAASPAPAQPEPRFIYGGRDDYRWQLGLGYNYVQFRSNFVNVGMSGLNVSVAYFLNEWFGLEGDLTTAFGSTLFANDRTNFLSFTGGPKIAWRGKRWEPWGHALFGGVHFNPQLAGVSKNGFAVVAGGGADFRYRPRLSFRFEGDWVRTQLFNTSQNNFQAVTGVIFHF